MSAFRPLKILMLASSYPRSTEDSASIFLRHLVRSLSERGLDIHVLAPADTDKETYLEENATVHRFRYFPSAFQQLAYGSGILPNLRRNPWLWIEVPFFIASMTYSLLRVTRREKPDLIHAHWILPQGLIALIAKSLFNIPVIATAHGSDAFALKGGLIGWMKRLVVRKSDSWTSNSRATAAAIGQAHSLPQAHIIPMGVHVDRFSSGRRANLRREVAESDFLVLFVGRLVENKGIRDLVEAFHHLPAELRSRTVVWLVGDGASRSELEQHCERLGISGRVRFWGQISNRLLPDFYAAADLFVAPSVKAAWGDAEGQGVVLLEAFAARLCVLATRLGGITEVVEDGHTGVLVEPGSPEELSSALAILLTDKLLRVRLAENAFNKVKRLYGWQRTAQDFEELYRRVTRPPD